MKTHIIALSANPEILEVMLRLLREREDIEPQGAYTIHEAVVLLSRSGYRAILLGSGFLEAEEQSLRSRVAADYPSVKIIEHYGGGSGLLKAELEKALKS